MDGFTFVYEAYVLYVQSCEVIVYVNFPLSVIKFHLFYGGKECCLCFCVVVVVAAAAQGDEEAG